MTSELESLLIKTKNRVTELKKIDYKSGSFSVSDIEKLLKIVGVMRESLSFIKLVNKKCSDGVSFGGMEYWRDQEFKSRYSADETLSEADKIASGE